MPQNTFATSGLDLVGYTIDNGRLELLSTLGVGAYGVVYLAVDLQAPTPVYLAVKCLLRAGLDSRQRHFQRREIALHQLASRHPGVVTLHKVLEEGEYIFVIMDFYDEGDLFGMITERQRYLGEDELIRKVFLQIVDAVEYCHSMGIFHRDLKPENILVMKDGSKVCIADFGLATSERISTDFGCGSTFYLSPECQGGLYERLDRYSTEHNDLWSLGVILVNLTCGRNPWRQATPSDETFRAFVNNPDFLRTILPISHQTHHILQGLFELEPTQRTPLKELRRQIMQVGTFTMTEEELRYAHSAARAAAAAVRPVAPVAPVHPPRHPLHVTVNAKESYRHSPKQPTHTDQQTPTSAYPHQVPKLVINVGSCFGTTGPSPSVPGAPCEDSWSCESMYDEEPEQPDMSMDCDSDDDARSSSQIVTPTYGTSDPDPFALAPNSSRSSSSEDVSLPPTPEFRPTDKPARSWQHSPGGGKLKEYQQAESLHPGYHLSPGTADFRLI